MKKEDRLYKLRKRRNAQPQLVGLNTQAQTDMNGDKARKRTKRWGRIESWRK